MDRWVKNIADLAIILFLVIAAKAVIAEP